MLCIEATIVAKILFAAKQAKRLQRKVCISLLLAETDPDIYRQGVYATQRILSINLVSPKKEDK
jgi:hypothetical protein